MSDRSLTLLAIHLDDAHVQIGPKRIDRSKPGSAHTPSDDDPEGAESTGSAGPVAGVLAILLAVLTLLALRRRVGGGSDTDLEVDTED